MFKRYSLILLVAILPLIAIMAFLWAPRYRFDSIIIHHTASMVDNYDSIRRYHTRKRHMKDAAYHLILSNGSAGVSLGELEATGRYGNLSYSAATRSVKHNLTGLHLCVVGNYEENEVPKDLGMAIGNAVKELQKKFAISDDKVMFHRDVGQTKCPGRYFTKSKLSQWLEADSGKLPESIARQQRAAIDSGRFSIFTVPGKAIVVVVGCLVVFVLVWLALTHILATRRQVIALSRFESLNNSVIN